MKTRMIDYPLYHNPVSIPNTMIGVSSQENCDGPEYDLMMEAAEYIRVLESSIDLLQTQSYFMEYGPSNDEESVTKDWLEKQDDPGIAQQALELLGFNSSDYLEQTS